MNRLTLGILLSLVAVLSITSLNYTPEVSNTNTCATSIGCDKPDCCQKVKDTCGLDCTKPCCSKKIVKSCGSDCVKPCCKQTPKKECGPNCTKPCCVKT